MDNPICYGFDPVTGVYTGPLEGDPSPLEPGVWHYPAHSCLDAPPEPEAGHAALRQGAVWTLVPDHRGETWWDAHGAVVVVEAVGDPAAAGLSSTAPPPPPPPPRQQLGNVFLGAVAGLGWWSLFDQGAAAQAAAGKPLDQRYWFSIGKADQVLAADAKLMRVARAAEAARVAASGSPLRRSPSSPSRP